MDPKESLTIEGLTEERTWHFPTQLSGNEQQRVTVGLRSTQEAEILSGLYAGSQVVRYLSPPTVGWGAGTGSLSRGIISSMP